MNKIYKWVIFINSTNSIFGNISFESQEDAQQYINSNLIENAETKLVYGYEYHREKTKYINGIIDYNINYLERYNQYGDITKLYQEVSKAFPGFHYTLTIATPDDPTLVLFTFDFELTLEQEQLLDSVVYNHENDVADKWGIYYPSSQKFEMYVGIVRMFATQEEAQQYITDNSLSGAITKSIVEL